MTDISLKRRIFLPLTLAALLIFVLSISALYRLQDRQWVETSNDTRQLLLNNLAMMQDDHIELMSALIRNLTADRNIIIAMKKQDRKALLASSGPYYREVNEKNVITHLYFHAPDMTNILRVHQPDRFGDHITRHTSTQATQDGILSSGMELGPLGTFTLRVVSPVFEQGVLLGYIEMGIEMNHLLKQIESMMHWKLILLIKKQYLSRQAWEQGMTMMQRKTHWDALPYNVLSQQNTSEVPKEIYDRILHKQRGKPDALVKNLVTGDRHYWVNSVPLPDAAGREIGSILILHDMTETVAGTRREMYLISGVFALLGLGIMLFFRRILGKTEADMEEARHNFVNEAELREAMQANHIEELLYEQGLLRDSEAKLARMREQQRLILEAAGEGIYGLDLNGMTTFVNPSAARMLGSTEEELIGQPMHSLLHHTRKDGSLFPREECPIYAAFKDGRTHHIEDDLFWRMDGNSLPVDYISTPVHEDGKITGAVVTFRDISKRKQAEFELSNALHVQRVLDSMLNMALSRMDMKKLLDQALQAIFSIPSFKLLDKGSIFLVAEGSDTLLMAAQRNLPEQLLQSCNSLPFGKCLCGKAAASRQIVFSNHIDERHEIRFDGIQPHGHYCLPIMAEDRLLGVLNIYVPAEHKGSESERIYLKTVADTLATIIERKHAEEQLRNLAHNDPLTGLPNRTLFLQRFDISLDQARRYGDRFALMFIDLDGFKKINDTHGHDIGDLLLKEVSICLQSCVRKADTVARMGGDEFTVLMNRITKGEHAAIVADKIIRRLGGMTSVGGRKIRIGCSIGIALFPEDGEDAGTLLKHADAAMYRAKQRHDFFCFHSPQQDPDETTAPFACKVEGIL